MTLHARTPEQFALLAEERRDVRAFYHAFRLTGASHEEACSAVRRETEAGMDEMPDDDAGRRTRQDMWLVIEATLEALEREQTP